MRPPHFFEYLTTTGARGGSVDMAVDASGVGGVKYYWTAVSLMDIQRIIIHYEDGANMRVDQFGAIGAALTNGIVIRHYSDFNTANERILDLTAGQPIKSNGGWSHLAYDAEAVDRSSGNSAWRVRWSFFKASPNGRGLPLDIGDRFEVHLQDDLTGLNEMHMMIQGSYVDVY